MLDDQASERAEEGTVADLAGSDDVETMILDRIASGEYSEQELEALRALGVRTEGRGNVVQVGKYNVRVQDGSHLTIGDHIYSGHDAESLLRAFAEFGQPRLHGIGGVLATIGFIICFSGLGIFFYTLFTDVNSDFEPGQGPSGPPPGIGLAFGVFFVGFAIAMIGGFIMAWRKKR